VSLSAAEIGMILGLGMAKHHTFQFTFMIIIIIIVIIHEFRGDASLKQNLGPQ